MMYSLMVGRTVGLVALSLAMLSASGLSADEKAPFDRKNAKDGGIGMPTPYDKFLALDIALPNGKVDWAKALRSSKVEIDPDHYTDAEVAIPMALGIRIADGVLAVKAKDAELLNQCANDIERLSRKMGIAESELGRARAVRTAANKSEWLKVFMELGFFQQDIMKKIESDQNPTRGTLLIVTGWMRGAQYTASLIEEHYTPDLSNILREPMLAKALRDKVESLPNAVKEKAAVAKLRQALAKVVQTLDIQLEGTITKENVAQIRDLAAEVVQGATAAAN